jgi:DNA processing protein
VAALNDRSAGRDGAPTATPMRPGDDGDCRALLELLDVPGMGSKRTYESLVRWRDARVALSRGPGGGPSKSVEGSTRERVARDRLRVLNRLAAHLLVPWSGAYPRRLRDLHDPPPALFGLGDATLLGRPSVAIVGSRRATPYGRRCAESVARAFARRGVVVISGLAMGIDGAAHRAALEVSGPTVAVLGNGVDAFRPRSNERLGAMIAESGLVVSEYPPGVAAQPHHFPQRNRIIAALADAVIVVEAASRSGALITVDHALDLGRDIYGVPGPIDRTTHSGVNAMLRDGAGVLDDPELLAADFAERFGLGRDGPAVGEVLVPSDTEPRIARVLSALDGGARTMESLADALRLETSETLALLTELEIGGWVRQDEGLRFRRM